MAISVAPGALAAEPPNYSTGVRQHGEHCRYGPSGFDLYTAGDVRGQTVLCGTLIPQADYTADGCSNFDGVLNGERWQIDETGEFETLHIDSLAYQVRNATVGPLSTRAWSNITGQGSYTNERTGETGTVHLAGHDQKPPVSDCTEFGQYMVLYFTFVPTV